MIVEEILNMAEEPNYRVIKEYFRHKNMLLFHGDILNKTLFDEQFIDLIVTSPPYNVGIDYNSSLFEL